MRRVRFPQLVKRGSFVVTIYKTPSRGFDGFTVAYYDPVGIRRRQTTACYAKAREIAVGLAERMATSAPESLLLTGPEMVVYRRALEVLAPVGAPLDFAATQFARAVGGADRSVATATACAGEAVAPTAVPRKMRVAEVVRELLEAKTASGRAPLYLQDLRVRLERFARAFALPLDEVSPNDIERFLATLSLSARSQNNFRSVIGTLIRFAQRRGYVSKEHTGVAGIDKSSSTLGEVAVFTPAEIKRLLAEAKPELVAALSIGAFAGVRSEELKRLQWEDVKLGQGHIEIRAAHSKTRVRRLIPISANLASWLKPFAKDCGPVTPFANLALQFDKLARKAGVGWKKNGLRHSFISYRVAQTGNVASVSLEAGNSPSVITRNYLKCVTSATAQEWFSTMNE